MMLNILHRFILLSAFIVASKGNIVVPYHTIPYIQSPPTFWYATCHCPLPPPPPEPDRELQDVLEYTKKIGESVCNVGTTLTEIGEIALEDDPAVGAAIIKKLQAQISSSGEIFADFTNKTAHKVNAAAGDGNGERGSYGVPTRRVKRAAKETGNSALNKVGELLSNANKEIEGEKKKLSKKARDKISKKHKDGLDKCRADSCKAAAKLLASEDDEDERQ